MTEKPRRGWKATLAVHDDPIEKLPKDTCQQIRAFVGSARPSDRAKADKIIGDIERIMGARLQKERLRNVPRPAEIRAALETLNRKAQALIDTINEADDFTRQQIRLSTEDAAGGDSVDIANTAVIRLQAALAITTKDFTARSRGGAPRGPTLKTETAKDIKALLKESGLNRDQIDGITQAVVAVLP